MIFKLYSESVSFSFTSCTHVEPTFILKQVYRFYFEKPSLFIVSWLIWIQLCEILLAKENYEILRILFWKCSSTLF